jgi:ABC-type sugar transport system ATPase subunit
MHGTIASAESIAVGPLLISAETRGIPPGMDVLWCVRPEHVALTNDGGGYPAAVLDVVDLGAVTTITVRLVDGPQLRVRTVETVDASTGDLCRISFKPDSVTVWPAVADSHDAAYTEV